MADSGFPAFDDSSQQDSTVADRLRSGGLIPEAKNDPDAETKLWEGGYSGKAMAGSWLLGLLAFVGLLVLLIMVPAMRSYWMIEFGIVFAIWIALAGMFVYRKLGHWYVLTTQRFKHRDGILTRMSDRIEVIDIDDVTCRQGIVEAMLGVGTIIIESSDTSHPQLTLKGIDNVKKVTDMIDDARRAERRKRGLHIEAI